MAGTREQTALYDAQMEKLTDEERVLALEEKQLRIEIMREQVAQMKEKKERQQATHAQVETDLADFARNQKAGQEQCNHRKGGVDVGGIRGAGTDHFYAIARHQLPLGDWLIICLRCQKTWTKGTPGYEDALSYPTDNSASGSSLFIITRSLPSVRVPSRLEASLSEDKG